MMDVSHDTVVAELARVPSLLVVCEFDGTIAEYVDNPATARPVDGALDALATLGSLDRTRAAVISGRSLESLRSAFGSDLEDVSSCRIELVGSGGIEIESQMTLGLTADARRIQRRLLQAAAQVADTHPGVTVDEKPYGVALHVSGAAAIDGQHAIERLLDFARSMPQRVYSQSRREVLDLSVLPVGQDWAIDALRQRGTATVLYAGNDERALASLSPGDIGCRVSAGCSGAALCLQAPAELVQILEELSHKRARVLAMS